MVFCFGTAPHNWGDVFSAQWWKKEFIGSGLWRWAPQQNKLNPWYLSMLIGEPSIDFIRLPQWIPCFEMLRKIPSTTTLTKHPGWASFPEMLVRQIAHVELHWTFPPRFWTKIFKNFIFFTPVFVMYEGWLSVPFSFQWKIQRSVFQIYRCLMRPSFRPRV